MLKKRDLDERQVNVAYDDVRLGRTGLDDQFEVPSLCVGVYV